MKFEKIDFRSNDNYYKIEVPGFYKSIRFYSASTRSSYRPVSPLLRARQYNLTTGLTLIILFRIFIEGFEIKCSLNMH
jgi:hypothetical protein